MGEIPSLPLERQLIAILAANREDAYETQRARTSALMGVARMLHEKFGLQKWENLKAKHVEHVIERFKAEDTGRRSIEGNLSHLRWLVRKIGKANLVPRSNAELGVKPGPRFTRAGKIIPEEQFQRIMAAIADPRMRMALLLGRHVGMRFREAMLFRPGRDFDGERVWLKRGTKGGRPRYLYVHDVRQREILAEAKALAGAEGSLTPREIPTFNKWRQRCYRAYRKAGLGRSTDAIFHDLRRGYVCSRMDYLIAKGRTWGEAAGLVSRELGHGRAEVLQWYIAERGDAAA